MTLSNEEIRQLHTALDQGEPELWIFEKDGLRVLGRVSRVETVQYPNGPSLTLILEVDDKERRLILTTVLESKLQRLDVKPGEPIAIERAAEMASAANGNPYWDYVVKRIEGSGQKELNWGTRQALPQETVDAEVVEDHYEVPHLPRVGEGGF